MEIIYEKSKVFSNKEIIDLSNDVLANSEYKDFNIQCILKNRDEFENTYVIASKGNEMIGFNPFENEIDIIPDWAYNFDEDFFVELEWNKEIIYITDDFHYNIWTDINKFYPKEIENKDGVIEYLKYCKKNKITRDRLQKVCKDVPLDDSLKFLKNNKNREKGR